MEGRDKRLYRITDYEALAKERLELPAHDYYNSGADDEVSFKN